MGGCPACGEEVSAGARFCPSCGRRLAAGDERHEERKVVSVLFVDLVGFTARSDRADPEDVRDLLAAYHHEVKSEIERFGGVVEKFIGDAVMAVFGAPLAHTDDAERAVRAGLRVLEAMTGVNARQAGADLTVRAAVNTGEAVVALGSGHELGAALALGDVVNTASRLQSAAPPGRLVVGEETYRATRHLIRYEELPAFMAKGKREPLACWLAGQPMVAPDDRAAPRKPLVGRTRELDLLASVWARAAERRPQLATVVGPPGIGKTRLAREFAGRVEAAGGQILVGRCLSYDTREVYAAFAQQVRRLAGIAERDPPELARQKLAVATDALCPGPESAELVRYLSLLLGLGVDTPVDERLLLFYAARRLVESLGNRQPALFVFEDVHWADDGLLDLIEYLAGHVRDSAVTFLALTRPELFDARPHWGSGPHPHTTVTLDPVSRDEAAAILANAAGPALPAQEFDRLVDVAEGNPLFLEELAAARAEGSEPGDELPTTVRAAIAGRVDALPAAHRETLLVASVAGRVFWLGALHALGRENARAELDDLEARDLVRRHPAGQPGADAAFSFKHALIRDVCYATLPRARRREAHRAVAGYLAELTGENDRELAGRLAHHWEAAGEPGKAIDYLLLAADRAEEAMADADAMALFDRAEGLAPDESTKTRIQLLRAMARARLEDFEAAYAELTALLPALDGRDRVEALLALSQSCHWTERTAEAIRTAEQALDMAPRVGAPDLAAPAMGRLSQAHAMRGEDGDLDRAIEIGERALATWPPGFRREDLAEHEHLLGDQHYWTGSYPRALELSRAAREHAVDPRSGEALLRGGGMEGLLLTAQGCYEEALASFERVIALGRELGRPVRVLLNYSTVTFRELYDLGEARRRSEESLAAAGRNPNFHMPWMNALVDLVHTDVLAGEAGAAMRRWTEIWDDVCATSAWERWLLGGKLAALRAEIALQAEGPPEAAEWAQRGIRMAQVVHRRKYEAVSRTLLGRALLGLGQREQAARELRAAVDIADALGSPFGKWRAKAGLADGLEAVGDEGGADRERRAAGQLVHQVASGLAADRAAAFLAAPDVAAVVQT